MHPPGTIVRVRLRNIRNHRHIVLDLHPRFNFIVGLNGSGKSSILLAIRLALGLRVGKTIAHVRRAGSSASAASGGYSSATATGAGGSASASRPGSFGSSSSKASAIDLTHVISYGSYGSDGEAIAEVDVSNGGPGDHDSARLPTRIWGEKFIRLRRTLVRTRDGKCSDKLEAFRDGDAAQRIRAVDAAGERVALSKGKEESWILRQLEERFNIQPDNPIMVMEQETAKPFVTCKGKDMYKLFLQVRPS